MERAQEKDGARGSGIGFGASTRTKIEREGEEEGDWGPNGKGELGLARSVNK